MPYGKVKGLLTDIGTEELAHVEIISAILYQLTRNLSIDQIKESGFDKYFVDHTTGIYPIAASGTPFTAAFFQSTGDVISDLVENLAAEQKARTTYDNILRITDDPDVKDVIKFLRQRELVHFQRFGDSTFTNLSTFTSKTLLSFSSHHLSENAYALFFSANMWYSYPVFFLLLVLPCLQEINNPFQLPLSV